MKKPSECENIDDIRNEIDSIDKGLIKLIRKRSEYVKAAAKFKKSEISVRAKDRVSKMLEKRRSWAVESKINPDFIEQLFSKIVEYFINKEMDTWENN